ncbi:Gfo/Idh/MocA family oxidoreductase [bacterium]|nr:Gfo/Idh/MocA family oxidoreductase [bacterium]
MGKLKAGVIGTGSMGRHHVRVLAENNDVELAGIADIDDERARELADKFSCDRFTDYRALLERNLDFAVVAVPTSLHYDVGIDVLRSGAHVLIEKPIADSVERAVEINSVAKDEDRKVFVGHIERFNPAVSATKEAMDSGCCGEILSISNLRIGQINQRIFDTGIILDLATHDIDLISHLLGERALSVYCVGSKKQGNFDDHASIMLKFPESRSGIIETSWLMPYKVRKIFVTGEKGFLLVDLVTRKIVHMEDKFIAEIPSKEEEPLKREIDSVVRSIIDDTPPVVSGSDSTYTLAVALYAVESYKSNSIIDIPHDFLGNR